MPEVLTAPVAVDTDLEAMLGDLEVSALDGTIANDALHEEEIDFRLPDYRGVNAAGSGGGGACVCGGGCATIGTWG